jgi:hypothetical protein
MQNVDLRLVSLEEISSDNTTVLQAIDLQTGTRFPTRLEALLYLQTKPSKTSR